MLSSELDVSLAAAEARGSAEGAELPSALCWGHWECMENIVRDLGTGVSHLYRCSVPRSSEKSVKVPDHIIVRSLVGFFYLFILNFFPLRPSDD